MSGWGASIPERHAELGVRQCRRLGCEGETVTVSPWCPACIAAIDLHGVPSATSHFSAPRRTCSRIRKEIERHLRRVAFPPPLRQYVEYMQRLVGAWGEKSDHVAYKDMCRRFANAHPRRILAAMVGFELWRRRSCPRYPEFAKHFGHGWFDRDREHRWRAAQLGRWLRLGGARSNVGRKARNRLMRNILAFRFMPSLDAVVVRAANRLEPQLRKQWAAAAKEQAARAAEEAEKQAEAARARQPDSLGRVHLDPHSGDLIR